MKRMFLLPIIYVTGIAALIPYTKAIWADGSRATQQQKVSMESEVYTETESTLERISIDEKNIEENTEPSLRIENSFDSGSSFPGLSSSSGNIDSQFEGTGILTDDGKSADIIWKKTDSFGNTTDVGKSTIEIPKGLNFVGGQYFTFSISLNRPDPNDHPEPAPGNETESGTESDQTGSKDV